MPSILSTSRFANRSIRDCARDCARDHMLMVMRCDLCGRTIDDMSISWHLPSAQELVAGLTVRIEIGKGPEPQRRKMPHAKRGKLAKPGAFAVILSE